MADVRLVDRKRNFFFFPSWLPHFLVGVFTRGPRAFKEKAERLLEQELVGATVTKWGRKKEKKKILFPIDKKALRCNYGNRWRRQGGEDVG